MLRDARGIHHDHENHRRGHAARLGETVPYTLAVLRKSDRFGTDGTEQIIWEHGRRNMGLNTDGALPVVCPVRDETDMAGIGIFTGTPEEVRAILDQDPAVQAGILDYTLHPCRSFPGSTLPHPTH